MNIKLSPKRSGAFKQEITSCICQTRRLDGGCWPKAYNNSCISKNCRIVTFGRKAQNSTTNMCMKNLRSMESSMMAENTHRISCVETKTKSEVKSTTVAKDHKETVRRYSVPSRAPKKKEEPKKKVNTFTHQWIHRPSGNGNNPEPGREYKRDNTTLVPIRNSPGDHSWTNKNWQGKNGKLSCSYHKPLGISAQDYLSQTPEQCIKSSMLGRRAEPVQAFTGEPSRSRKTRATGNQPPHVVVTKRGWEMKIK